MESLQTDKDVQWINLIYRTLSKDTGNIEHYSYL